jgi:hypothetical protein
MRIAAIAFFLALICCAAQADTYDIAQTPDVTDVRYRQCSTRADCVSATLTPCSAPIAINRDALPIVEAWYNYVAPRVSCNVSKVNPTIAPNCLGGICGWSAIGYIAAHEDTERPTWCHTVEDCTVATDSCGHHHPVNLAHRDIMQQGFDVNPTPVRTCDWIEKRPILELRCASNSCRVLLDNHAAIPR